MTRAKTIIDEGYVSRKSLYSNLSETDLEALNILSEAVAGADGWYDNIPSVESLFECNLLRYMLTSLIKARFSVSGEFYHNHNNQLRLSIHAKLPGFSAVIELDEDYWPPMDHRNIAKVLAVSSDNGAYKARFTRNVGTLFIKWKGDYKTTAAEAKELEDTIEKFKSLWYKIEVQYTQP